MGNSLNQLLEDAQANNHSLVCVNGDEFTEAVLLNGATMPWTEPTEFVATYGRLMELLKPDVASFSVDTFFRIWLDANPGALVEMRGKNRVRYSLKKLLGMNAARDLVREIIEGLLATIDQPLLLRLPPNAEFVNWANMRANDAADREISDFDVDTVSVYLADFLRAFSGLNIGGAVFQLPRGAAVNAQTTDLYSPVINVARHYRWSVGAIAPDPNSVSVDETSLDFCLSNGSEGSGSLLNGDSWARDFDPPRMPIVYAHVPDDVAPDLAADCVSRWRRRA